MSGFAESVTGWAFSTGWSLVRRLPERPAYALFERFADASWARRGPAVRRLESNLHRVLGPAATEAEVRLLSRAGMRSYLRYWCDAFRLPGWSRERIVDEFQIHGEQHLVDALALGRGAVVALPHMGNWDHAGGWFCLRHGSLVTVAERLKPEELYEQFLAYRRALGMEVLPLTGGDPAFPTLLRRLREGKLVALLADRDLTEHGLTVELFGAPARFPAGPATLAVQTGAALLPVTLWHAGGRNHARIHAPLDTSVGQDKADRIQQATQRLAEQFEDGISAHPEDWHMLQRLWVADLDPAKEPAR
ncbi:MAG TPA: phosphatidylinositol mannoside acyltransferase [Candidatus Nanopelagicales bacterium]|jgi:KDO2-lipid IV(A) lauroyltransferase|nr:phosphatidylinositol mannoside acyltransferase [Candidatus Nanopelagicales bacterium]